MTVSAPQRVAQVILSTSSSMEDATALLPMLALILTRKPRPMAIGSTSGWFTLTGRTARPRATSSRTNSGRQPLADRDELHLRRHHAGAGVRQLGHGAARQRAPRAAAGLLEDAVQVAVVVRLEPVVDGLHRTSVVRLGVAALGDPVRAQRGQAQPHVGAQLGVGVRAGGVVEDDAVAGRQHHLAHRHAQVGAAALQVGLARARERRSEPRRGVLDSGHLGFLPTPVLAGSGANGQRPVLPPSQPRREAPAGRRGR